MVKRVIRSLAESVLGSHASLLVNITRLRHGFLVERNLVQARETIRSMNQTLDEIEATLRGQHHTHPQNKDDYLPLK